MFKSFRFAVLGLTGLLATSTGVAVAVTTTDAEEPGANAAATAPPPIVEDYSYPGADRIQQERGTKLLKGDGNIVLADCSVDEALIEVHSREVATSCYRVVGNSGSLTMEIPEVYTIKGDDHAIQATVTMEGNTEVVDVPQESFVPVGEGENPDSGPATLLELRTS